MISNIRSLKSGIVLASLAVALTACESVSDSVNSLNPFAEEEKKLSGERQSVFTGNQVLSEENRASGAVIIGGASGNSNWPQGAGNAANNPGNVSVGGTNRAWAISLGQDGGGRWLGGGDLRVAARPVVYQGRVFTYEHSARVTALSLSGGGRAWSTSLQPEKERGAGAGGGVAADNGRIFAATGYGELAALDAGSGKVLWRKELLAPARGAPAAADGKVFVVTQNNEVFAIDQAEGTELWSFAGIPESAGLLSEANPAVSGDTVVVPFTSGEVMAIGIKSGEPKWVDAVTKPFRTLAVSGISDVAASPVINNGAVIATGVAGKTIAVSLNSGERLWERDLGGVHTPVASGNAVFMIDLDDRLVALDRKTGKTFWSTQLPIVKTKKKRTNWAGPLLGNGRLYAISSEGSLAQVDPISGQITSQTNPTKRAFVAPIAANGYMILVDPGGLTALR